MPAPSTRSINYIIKPSIFLACLLPFIALAYAAVMGSLGANPVETLTLETGEWALRFLLITLAITPLRKLTHQPWLIKLRRMLGLFVFFYALLHFITYIWFDQFFNWTEIVKDIVKRPFITVGFSAFVLLIPLAFTSSDKMMRRLKRNWVKLHSLIYVIGVLAVFHFLWLVKADTREPLIYAAALLVLLAYRAVAARMKNEK